MSEPFRHFRRHCDNCVSLGPYLDRTARYDLYLHPEPRDSGEADQRVLAKYSNDLWDYEARRVFQSRDAESFHSLSRVLREAMRRASTKNLLPAGVFVSWESQP
jgi:hypothetical protein